MAKYVPPQHIEALKQQAETGTPAEQQAARKALEMHNVPAPRSQVATEEQAREIYKASGGDPKKFYYDPTGSGPTRKQEELSKYEVRDSSLDKVLPESKARALFEASGGDPSKFEYKPPKFYDTLKLANDIDSGQAKLSKSDYDSTFGKGAYDKAVKLTKNMVIVNDGREWVNKDWYNSLPSNEKDTVKSGGLDAWNQEYLREDPVTKYQYHVKDIAPAYGNESGGIDWNQLHENQIATDVWDKILSDKPVKYKDYEQFTGDNKGAEYAKSIVNEFEGLPKTDQLYIKEYGLANWTQYVNDRQFRYELADRVLEPFKTDDGKVDIVQFAAHVRDNDLKPDIVVNVLSDYGIDGKDIMQGVYMSQKIPKSQTDPDSFMDHFRNQANKVSRYVADKADLGGEYLWEAVKHVNPGHYIMGTSEEMDKIGKGISTGLTTLVSMPAQLTASYLDVGAGFAMGERESATARLAEMAPITYYEDKWTGFGPEMVKESRSNPYEAIPRNLVLIAPAVYGAGGLAVKGVKAVASKSGYPSVKAMAENQRGSMKMEWREDSVPEFRSTGSVADYIRHVRDTEGYQAAIKLQESIQKHGNPKYLKDLPPEAIPQRAIESATRNPLPFKEVEYQSQTALSELFTRSQAKQLQELMEQSAVKHAQDIAMAEKTATTVSYDTAVALSIAAMTAKQIAQEIAIDSDLAAVYARLSPAKTLEALQILNAVKMDPKTDTKTKTQTAVKTDTKTKTKTAVATKTATKIRTAVKTQVATKTAVKTKTKTKTAVATKTAVKTKTKTKTAVDVKTKTDTMLDEPVATQSTDSVLPIPGPGEPPRKKMPVIGPPGLPPVLPRKGGVLSLPDGKKIVKVESKRGKPGKVAWNQGEVTKDGKRERVYIIAEHDGSTIKRGKGGVVVKVGDPPPGMRRKKGTPQETLTIIGGEPPPKLRVRTGAVDAIIKDGRMITFRSAKRQGKVVRGPQPRVIRGKRGRR